MSDKNKKEVVINRDEFAELMFSQDENLNLMLSNLAPLKPKPSSAHNNAAERNTTENKLKYFLQKGLKNMTIDLFRQDEDRNYEIDTQGLLKIINKRVQIPMISVTEQPDGTTPEAKKNKEILGYASKF